MSSRLMHQRCTVTLLSSMSSSKISFSGENKQETLALVHQSGNSLSPVLTEKAQTDLLSY